MRKLDTSKPYTTIYPWGFYEQEDRWYDPDSMQERERLDLDKDKIIIARSCKPFDSEKRCERILVTKSLNREDYLILPYRGGYALYYVGQETQDNQTRPEG